MYCHGLAFALATLRQPGGKAFGEPFGGEAEAGFDPAIRDRKRVVKVSRVGEIAHAELIEPIERAGAAFAANHHVDIEFLRVHEARKASSSSHLHISTKKVKTRYEARGRFTEWARPTASSIQIKYQPMSV